MALTTNGSAAAPDLSLLDAELASIDAAAARARRHVLDLHIQLRTIQRERDELASELALLRSSTSFASSSTSILPPPSPSPCPSSAPGGEGQEFVAVLVDGDGCVFLKELLCQGKDGGKEAARRLSEGLGKALGGLGAGRVPVVIQIFCDRANLSHVLSTRSMCTPQSFSRFLTGFSEASPLFTFLDAGPRKESSDHKLRAHLSLFAHQPACRAVVFGGGHDAGYLSAIEELFTEGLGERLWLIGYGGILGSFTKGALKGLKGRVVSLPNVFMTQRIDSPRASLQLTLHTHPTTSSHSAPTSQHISLQSITAQQQAQAIKAGRGSNAVLRSSSVASSVFSTGSIWQREPRPCLAFYLASCTEDPCKFSHAHTYSPSGLLVMRTEALTLPCPRISKSSPTPECLDSSCFRGHVCPDGAGYIRPNCFFKAKGSHPPSAAILKGMSKEEEELCRRYEAWRERDQKTREKWNSKGTQTDEEDEQNLCDGFSTITEISSLPTRATSSAVSFTDISQPTYPFPPLSTVASPPMPRLQSRLATSPTPASDLSAVILETTTASSPKRARRRSTKVSTSSIGKPSGSGAGPVLTPALLPSQSGRPSWKP